MTTEQVYKMAGTDSELLNHIKSRKKLRYFGHIMRLLSDDRSCRGDKKPWTCWIDNIVAWTDQSGTNLLRIAPDTNRD